MNKKLVSLVNILLFQKKNNNRKKFWRQQRCIHQRLPNKQASHGLGIVSSSKSHRGVLSCLTHLKSISQTWVLGENGSNMSGLSHGTSSTYPLQDTWFELPQRSATAAKVCRLLSSMCSWWAFSRLFNKIFRWRSIIGKKLKCSK